MATTHTVMKTQTIKTNALHFKSKKKKKKKATNTKTQNKNKH